MHAIVSDGTRTMARVRNDLSIPWFPSSTPAPSRRVIPATRRGVAQANLKFHSGAQGLAIGQHDLFDSPDRIAVLDGRECDRDFVAWLETILAPTQVDHVRRIAGLGRPVGDGALV